MIALRPADVDAQRLAIDGGEEPNELHCTLYYLGDATNFSEDARAQLIDLVREYVYDSPTLTVDGFAISMFNPPGTERVDDDMEREPCVVLGLSGSALTSVHDAVATAIEDHGVDLPEQHSPWVPHITLVYTDDADLSAFTEKTGPVTLDTVCVYFGDDRYEIPLDESSDDDDDDEQTTGDAAYDVELSDAGELIVPNVLLDWRAWVTLERERDVNLPSGPGHQLRDYWVHGPGALKIRWNTEGDGTRCIRYLRKYVKDPGGLCQEYHRLATGKSMHPHPGRVTESSDTVTLSDTSLYGRPNAEGGADVPWHVEKRGDEFCVVKDADDSVAGCHNLRTDAINQLRALYASEPDVAADARVVGDCPPGHHRMPSGECMADEDMTSPTPTSTPAVGPSGAYELDPAATIAPWEGVLTLEGVESGDGRMFAAGSLSWDTTPSDGLPLMWQKETSHGGQGDVSVRVGSVQEVWREPDPGGRADVNMIRGRGVFDLRNPDGHEAHRRMWDGFMSGNSVDVDSVKDASVEVVYPATVTESGSASSQVFGTPELTVFHRGRIRGTTLVEFPAFTEARLHLINPVTASAEESGDDDVTSAETATTTLTGSSTGATEVHVAASSDASWDAGANETRLPSPLPLSVAKKMFAYVDTSQVENGHVPKSAGKLPHHEVSVTGAPGAANLTGVSAAIGALHGARTPVSVPSGARHAIYEHLAAHLRAAGREPPPFSLVAERTQTLVAATSVIQISDTPPREWFAEPVDVPAHGALTVTAEGRVYGYLAPLNVRHRSFSGRNQLVPFKNVDYDRFMGGETIVADGGRVTTGPITMNCGHLPPVPGFDALDAQEHYDNSCSVVAAVRVGENQTGVWVAGALLPDVTPAQVTRMMTCRLSGDWRPHLDRFGWRELTAALLVPVPGFPMARVAPSVSVDDGQLVAAAVPLEFLGGEPQVNLRLTVDALRAETSSLRRTLVQVLARRVGRDPRSRADQLRARVHESEG
jgi:2'-5' RNA ligase